MLFVAKKHVPYQNVWHILSFLQLLTRQCMQGVGQPPWGMMADGLTVCFCLTFLVIFSSAGSVRPTLLSPVVLFSASFFCDCYLPQSWMCFLQTWDLWNWILHQSDPAHGGISPKNVSAAIKNQLSRKKSLSGATTTAKRDANVFRYFLH